jgi:glycosyltransferase involved in cell wall biosynthesis
MRNMEPLVSVNIPTLNSEGTLAGCLESVVKQSYGYVETIVIDSYSNDATVKIAKSYGAKVLYEKGLPAQRMRGISESNGQYILLLDSDQELEPSTISRCVDMCEREYDALILREKSVYEEKSWISKLLAYNMEIVQNDADPFFGTALPRFFRASFLKKMKPIPRDIGYFDHAFIYYETLSMGATAGYVDAWVCHREAESLKKVVRKFYKYYGKCLTPSLQYRTYFVARRVLPRRSYLSTLKKRPDLFIGLNFLYFIKALSTMAGLVSYFLVRGN